MVAICCRSQCLQPPGVDPEESLCLCNPEVKGGNEDPAKAEGSGGGKSFLVSWGGGRKAHAATREPSSAPNFHVVAAGEELNNKHFFKKRLSEARPPRLVLRCRDRLARAGVVRPPLA